MWNNKMTLREAAQEWVRGFNAIPREMICKLWNVNPEDWCEVTHPQIDNNVYAYNWGSGKIIDVDYENNQYLIELNSGDTIWLDEDQLEVVYDDQLPMWGTMWSFGENLDNYWLEENGIKLMSQCGFRIFKSEEFDYFFGIDGAGYDFYEEHWIPLYNKRGLKWHDIKAYN